MTLPTSKKEELRTLIDDLADAHEQLRETIKLEIQAKQDVIEARYRVQDLEADIANIKNGI